MRFTTPQSLQHEHEALHERLRQATRAGGEVGAAAKTLARLMHPHFVKEDQIALPPLLRRRRVRQGTRDEVSVS